MNKFVVGTVAAFSFVLFAATTCGASSPLDDLLPRPVRVEMRPGTGSATPVRTIRAPVSGAPSAVAAEAYVLDIAPSGVTITASDSRGERYARVTLDQLTKLSRSTSASASVLDPQTSSLPCCHIVDWPVLRWRGYMNDCGRNYLELSGVKAILDVMAAYKLNLFHWHLTDYHGWRLESKKFPALQSAKAFCGRQPGRFYTQDEFKEIVAYAADRGITVMPELDVPGHTLALRRGLGVDSMSAPGVGEKVTELFRELCSLAPADVMPFVHLGTDEARTREETCDDAWVTTWARAVNACGRKAVVWAPGKMTAPGCDVIDMAWYDNYVTNSTNPFLYADYVRGYNGSWTPFDVLSFVTFADPRHWTSETGRQLGAIGCTWHDDNVGEDTLQLFRECMVFPSLLGFADNYWSGRRMDHPEFLARLPRPGDPYFSEAVELERRLIRQRDTAFADFAHPFPFVGQTRLRWRVTDAASGQVVARDVPQGTVWVRNRRRDENSFIGGKGDTKAILETWIRSPDDRTVGAWIDCAGYYGAYTRGTGPTMQAGQWNRAGATVSVNSEPIAPPDWKQPDMKATTKTEREQDIPYSSDLNEKPLVDELPTLRPPTPVRLRKGWNHVRIVLPRTGSNWGATFCPIAGTSEHPREIDDLEYRSAP